MKNGSNLIMISDCASIEGMSLLASNTNSIDYVQAVDFDWSSVSRLCPVDSKEQPLSSEPPLNKRRKTTQKPNEVGPRNGASLGQAARDILKDRLMDVLRLAKGINWLTYLEGAINEYLKTICGDLENYSTDVMIKDPQHDPSKFPSNVPEVHERLIALRESSELQTLKQWDLFVIEHPLATVIRHLQSVGTSSADYSIIFNALDGRFKNEIEAQQACGPDVTQLMGVSIVSYLDQKLSEIADKSSPADTATSFTNPKDEILGLFLTAIGREIENNWLQELQSKRDSLQSIAKDRMKEFTFEFETQLAKELALGIWHQYVSQADTKGKIKRSKPSDIMRRPIPSLEVSSNAIKVFLDFVMKFCRKAINGKHSNIDSVLSTMSKSKKRSKEMIVKSLIPGSELFLSWMFNLSVEYRSEIEPEVSLENRPLCVYPIRKRRELYPEEIEALSDSKQAYAMKSDRKIFRGYNIEYQQYLARLPVMKLIITLASLVVAGPNANILLTDVKEKCCKRPHNSQNCVQLFIEEAKWFAVDEENESRRRPN